MNLVWFCLLVACLLPYVFTGAAKIGGVRAGRRFDNHNPRDWLTGLEGWPRRAWAAHANSWEALPVFMAGLLAAHLGGLPAADIAFWSVWFVVARILYGLLYIFNFATLRSIAWTLAVYAPLHLIVRAI